MTLGEVVDYCITYNERQRRAEQEEKKPRRRLATGAEAEAFFSG